MVKKKILVFIDWYLPGYKAGGPIQSCANLVAHLNDSYDFSVVTRDADYCEFKPYPGIKSNAWNILPDGTKVYYISQDKLNRKIIKEIISAENFDAVYLNGIYSLYFSLLPLYYLKRNRNKLIVIATRGMVGESALSIKKTKKKFFLRASKLTGLFNNVVFHATTSTEAKDIKTQFGEKVKIKVAANLPKKEMNLPFLNKIKEQGFMKLVNIARIAPEKNLKYALEVLKNVKGKVEFDIYGPIYHSEYWKECMALIKTMPSNIKVNYKQSIESDKIPGLLSAYHFMLMPTRGENFGHIILESLAASCPVIISDQTPWRNLKNKKTGWDISLSNPAEFTEIIEKCIEMDQQEYDQWSENAFLFAREVINDKEVLEENKKLFV